MTKIILLGEAWGAREELFEHAFVGASGRELAKMLFEAKLVPPLPLDYPSELDMVRFWADLRATHEIEVANVFNCRPPDNKIETFFTNAKEGLLSRPAFGRGKYLRPELAIHLDRLDAQLRAAAPNLIIAFGNTACWATLGTTGISTIRGTVKMAEGLGIKVLPTYHPAAVLRQWNLRSIVVADLEKASREAASTTITRIERWLTVDPSLAEIEEWLSRPAEFYAVDIENNKLITMIGFARSHNDAIVIPFFDENRPGGSYWPTVAEEMAAWKLADKALSAPIPKIFQNGIYDLSHLLRAGFRPTRCQEDTMLLHHSLYPEMLKGLGFLGSIYSDEIAWKSMRGKGNNLKRDE